jgi:hypothetical protein
LYEASAYNYWSDCYFSNLIVDAGKWKVTLVWFQWIGVHANYHWSRCTQGIPLERN